MKKHDVMSWPVVKAAAEARSQYGFKSIPFDQLRSMACEGRRLVWLDTETTGLTSDDRVIELCAMDDKAAWVGKFNPDGKSIEAGAMRVHGITEEMLRDKPLFAWRARDILEHLRDSVWLAHNAPFDARFMALEFARTAAAAKPGTPEKDLFTRFVDIPFFDTRRFGPALGLTGNSQLGELCVACGFSGDRSRHSATDDVLMLKKITEHVLSLGAPLTKSEKSSQPLLTGL